MTPAATTQVEPGLTFRRYVLDDGRTIETYELPATVVRSLGVGKLHEYLDAWHRGEQKRAKSAELTAAIEERLREGVKPLAIADELKCSETYVRQMRKARGQHEKAM